VNYGFGVTFRRIKEDDLLHLFEWRNQKDIYFWCRQSSPLHWMGHLSWFKKQAFDAKLSMFAILNDRDRLAGVCGLTDIDMLNRRAEFSCYIEPMMQDAHLGSGALKTLFMHGFKDLGLNRIWGETYVDNPAFDIFTKRLGMDAEGSRKEFYFRDGRFIDCHLVSISASKFLDLHGNKKTSATNPEPTKPAG
jgi:RimJ/RimL family protein N-acetyltransferase